MPLDYEIDDSNWKHYVDEFDILVKIDKNHRDKFLTFDFIRSDEALKLLSIEGVKDVKMYSFGLCFVFNSYHLLDEEFQTKIGNLRRSMESGKKYNLC